MFEEQLKEDRFLGEALMVKISWEDDSFLIRKQTEQESMKSVINAQE